MKTVVKRKLHSLIGAFRLAGYFTWNEEAAGSNPVSYTKWFVRLMVRTQDFHSCNMGSIPIQTAYGSLMLPGIITWWHKECTAHTGRKLPDSVTGNTPVSEAGIPGSNPGLVTIMVCWCNG